MSKGANTDTPRVEAGAGAQEASIDTSAEQVVSPQSARTSVGDDLRVETALEVVRGLKQQYVDEHAAQAA